MNRSVIARSATWAVAHRGRVTIGWIVLLVVAMAAAQAAKPHYVNNLALPGTDSQRATDLLKRSFAAQAGDSDQIVLHVGTDKVTDGPVRTRASPVLARVARLPHVTGVQSPFAPAGARAVSD